MRPFISKPYQNLLISALFTFLWMLFFFSPKIVKGDPLEEAYYNFLLSQLAAENATEAETYLQKAIRFSKGSLLLQKQLLSLYLENKKIEEARKLAESLYKKFPEEQEIVYLLGRVYLEENRPQRAMSIFERYLEKRPKDEQILSLMITLYLEQREWDQALKRLEQLEKFHPENYVIFLYKARIYREKGDYESAKRAYLKALELSPENKSLIFETLRFLESISAFSEIEKILLDYLAKNPEDKDFLRLLLGFYLEHKDYEKSEELLKKYLEKHKDQPEFLFYLGLTLEYKGKEEEALKIYKEISSQNLWYLEAQKRILELLKKKDLNEARSYLENLSREILEKNSIKEKSYYLFLSHSYERLDLCERGILIAKEGLIHYPEDPDLILALASNLACLENYEEVLKLVEPLLERYPEDAYILNFVGYSLVELERDLDRAEELLLKANELKPKDPYILDSLGWLYYKMKDYEKARYYLEEAFKNAFSEEPVIWAHLGEIYLKLGEKERACELFKKAESVTIHQRELEKIKTLLDQCK